ncbi:TetR/AcrR family transcriptional regulator [Oscillospiraceae bacterium HV4-5-C5C]|nr:TetR/AcrR family transcriptional regulator [Oscillospiraceae bacterium HV4-5-C5C]
METLQSDSRTRMDSRSRILEAARDEFLRKGYRAASLRDIAQTAGVTTGSFYWHFKNKADLFEALTGPHVQAVMALYDQAELQFEQLTPPQQRHKMGEIGAACAEQMLHYMYQHLSAFKILFRAAAGTRYETFVHDLTQKEIVSTNRYLAQLQQEGQPVSELDPWFPHLVVSGMFTAMFEMIIHGLPEDRALACLRQLTAFYTAGWRNIMGL